MFLNCTVLYKNRTLKYAHYKSYTLHSLKDGVNTNFTPFVPLRETQTKSVCKQQISIYLQRQKIHGCLKIVQNYRFHRVQWLSGN